MKLDRHHTQDCREPAVVGQEVDGAGGRSNADLFHGEFHQAWAADLQQPMPFKVSNFRIRVGGWMSGDAAFAAKPFGVHSHGSRKDVVFSVSPVLIHFRALLLLGRVTAGVVCVARSLERLVFRLGGGPVDRQRHLGGGGERDAIPKVHFVNPDVNFSTAELRQGLCDGGLNLFSRMFL